MSVLRFLAVGTVTAGLITLAGCGGGGPSVAEVEGTITLNGKPLDKIHVEFWPEVNGPRSIGMTDAQGRFTLMTDDGKRTGAVVGPHRIVLRDTIAVGEKFLGRRGDGADLRKSVKPARISTKYGDPQKTPLKEQVSAGMSPIDLKVVPLGQ